MSSWLAAIRRWRSILSPIIQVSLCSTAISSCTWISALWHCSNTCKASKNQSHRELQQSRSGGAHHLAKRAAADVSIHRAWAVKLRVVEGVETLQAQLEGFRFGELPVLLHRQIVIVDSRPGEQAAAAVAN